MQVRSSQYSHAEALKPASNRAIVGCVDSFDSCTTHSMHDSLLGSMNRFRKIVDKELSVEVSVCPMVCFLRVHGCYFPPSPRCHSFCPFGIAFLACTMMHFLPLRHVFVTVQCYMSDVQTSIRSSRFQSVNFFNNIYKERNKMLSVLLRIVLCFGPRGCLVSTHVGVVIFNECTCVLCNSEYVICIFEKSPHSCVRCMMQTSSTSTAKKLNAN